MNEVRLIIRFATRPELVDKDNSSPLVLCKWQDLERQENILVQYIALKTFTFFFGKIEDIVLTDSYYIEAHLANNLVEQKKRLASFTLCLERVIDTTEGRFGDQTLENVRHKATIRSIRLTDRNKDNGAAEVAEAMRKRKPYDELATILEKGRDEISNIEIKYEDNNKIKALNQEEAMKKASETEPHDLLKTTLDESEKQNKSKQKQQKANVVDLETLEKESGDDLPMG